MFLGHNNPKLCVSVNAAVDYLCKITVLRKKQLKVEILHNLKDFERNFKILFDFQNNLS